MANQKFTSANTSINSKRLPALFSNSYVRDFVLCCPLSLRCVDIGGGKYDNAVSHFAKFGHFLSVYDKYNRTEEQNRLVLSGSYDVAFCSNVLNVIDSREERYNVVKLALSLAPECYISVYEGDKTGIGRETKKDCYQLNQPIRFYLDELLEMGFIVDFADSKIIHVVRDDEYTSFYEIGSFITRKGV